MIAVAPDRTPVGLHHPQRRAPLVPRWVDRSAGIDLWVAEKRVRHFDDDLPPRLIVGQVHALCHAGRQQHARGARLEMPVQCVFAAARVKVINQAAGIGQVLHEVTQNAVAVRVDDAFFSTVMLDQLGNHIADFRQFRLERVAVQASDVQRVDRAVDGWEARGDADERRILERDAERP